MASDKSQTEISSIKFSRISSLHTLGTTIDLVSIYMEINRSFDTHSSSSYFTIQLSDWSKPINMAEMITGINDDDSLSATIESMKKYKLRYYIGVKGD